MTIILIGNYPSDRQESMERFAIMMQNGFRDLDIETHIWRPVNILASKAKNTNAGVAKWLGYTDKWILFPLIIRWRIFSKKLDRKDVYFHVCDHSNSFYLNQLPKKHKSITCHDVIAIRAAFGHADAHNPTSNLGLYLQKWILNNLGKAKKLAAVSHLSLKQLSELVPDNINPKTDWAVIHNAFNANFYSMSKAQASLLLAKAGIADSEKFILHIGSDLPRKNRKLLVEMLKELGDNYQGYICFAGHAIDPELNEYAKSAGLSSRIKNVVAPEHETLVALYSACDAFIFPSFSEGFGWPITEAQACGAVVITSNIAPMPEVSGEVALYADPYNPKTFAEAFLLLKDPTLCADLIQKGYKNAANFEVKTMINKYIKLFELKH
jgi:glycosyltransferase involved in cell wall biosynthesis